jgi:endonuclease/exonuclease/phosphatase family metal-dependent hydrolase
MIVILALLLTATPLLLYAVLTSVFGVGSIFKTKKKREINYKDGLVDIPQFYFNTESNKWEQYTYDGTDVHLPENVRIASFNTLFDLYESRHSMKRYDYQISTLLPEQDAHIIALNEVTRHYLAQLLDQEWTKEYYVTRISKGGKKGYKRNVDVKHFFSVILSKTPFTRVQNYWFSPTVRTKRSAIVGHFQLRNGTTFTLCTAHLVARQNRHLERRKQLRELIAMLRGNPSLLVGDMNIHSETEQIHLEKQLVDVWKQVKPKEPGYTFDMVRNKMLTLGHTLNGARIRLDRMFAIEAKHVMKCNDIRLFGDEPIEKRVFPSDHFGLVGDFEFV